jgi:hypothetical protein
VKRDIIKERADLLEQVGREMFGSSWQTDLAIKIGVAPRTVRFWRRCERPISDVSWQKIAGEVGRTQQKLRFWLDFPANERNYKWVEAVSVLVFGRFWKTQVVKARDWLDNCHIMTKVAQEGANFTVWLNRVAVRHLELLESLERAMREFKKDAT